jgi:hypothetical protein
MASQTNTFNMAGRRYRLTPESVEQRMHGVPPERVSKYFVVVEGVRYPPKQVLALTTGVPLAKFTTHQALRQCRKLGFVTGETQAWAARTALTGRYARPATRSSRFSKRSDVKSPRREPSSKPTKTKITPAVLEGWSPSKKLPSSAVESSLVLENALRGHVGEWVATRGDELLFAAPDAKSVVAWLTRHDICAESMYKVPADLDQVVGAAPA